MPAAAVPASEQTRAKSQSSAAEQRSEADGWLAKTRASLPQHTKRDFGTPPEMPTGPMSAQLTRDIDPLFGKNLEGKSWKPEQTEALARLASSKDPRVVWMLSDLMRIASDPRLLAVLTFAATNLLGVDLNPERHWGSTVDVLIAWVCRRHPDILMPNVTSTRWLNLVGSAYLRPGTSTGAMSPGEAS